ncbi:MULTISPECIES: type II toxin-antitoxin system VapC family toxin [unclassified Caulobacter]|uniref:type II toxin-antitoxin system VapC family toxin n=1 Tax=unclassified Caulobacter TaxID=2648921 RepID=UPI000D345A2F|nr:MULTISPECIES: type II toxin-antitoxin system VapC family toxin [unclassified Caulobacter]PTS90355.1 VapC toxin family PIN domain ribonuclease [Caulobacter sp. HMWF009]PTT08071.1 VapC toxin family PIN domain ribonuclease [Caulobacter sp. HMWF025]
MFLLDTNVVSDSTKQVSHPAVSNWLASQPRASLFVSVVSLAEVSYGIERLPPGRKADELRLWRASLVADFAERLLPVDGEVALVHGRLRRAGDTARRTIPVMDAFLAATAEVHGLTIVTRNVRDFEAWGGPVFNPWPDGAGGQGHR